MFVIPSEVLFSFPSGYKLIFLDVVHAVEFDLVNLILDSRNYNLGGNLNRNHIKVEALRGGRRAWPALSPGAERGTHSFLSLPSLLGDLTSADLGEL